MEKCLTTTCYRSICPFVHLSVDIYRDAPAIILSDGRRERADDHGKTMHNARLKYLRGRAPIFDGQMDKWTNGQMD